MPAFATAVPAPLMCPYTLLCAVHSLACALTRCHDRGVAHLDVKPDNVLLTTRALNGRPSVAGLRLGDFGMARSFDPYEASKAATALAVAAAVAAGAASGNGISSEADGDTEPSAAAGTPAASAGAVLRARGRGRPAAVAALAVETPAATAVTAASAPPKPDPNASARGLAWLSRRLRLPPAVEARFTDVLLRRARLPAPNDAGLDAAALTTLPRSEPSWDAGGDKRFLSQEGLDRNEWVRQHAAYVTGLAATWRAPATATAAAAAPSTRRPQHSAPAADAPPAVVAAVLAALDTSAATGAGLATLPLDKIDIFALGATALELYTGMPQAREGAAFESLRRGELTSPLQYPPPLPQAQTQAGLFTGSALRPGLSAGGSSGSVMADDEVSVGGSIRPAPAVPVPAPLGAELTAALMPLALDVARARECSCCRGAASTDGASPVACELVPLSATLVAAATALAHSAALGPGAAARLGCAVSRALSIHFVFVARSLIAAMMHPQVLQRYVFFTHSHTVRLCRLH
jgi:serine/threonine protein kinase